MAKQSASVYGLNRGELEKMSQVFIQAKIDPVTDTIAKRCKALKVFKNVTDDLKLGDGISNLLLISKPKPSSWTGLVEWDLGTSKLFVMHDEETVKKTSSLFKARVLTIFDESVSGTIGYSLYEAGKLVESLSDGPDYSEELEEFGALEGVDAGGFKFKSKIRKLTKRELEEPDGRRIADELLKSLELRAPQLPRFGISAGGFGIKLQYGKDPSMERVDVVVLRSSYSL